MTRYLSLPALAEETGQSIYTLKRWVKDGHLRPYTYSGTRRLYRVEDVEAAAIAAGKAGNAKVGYTPNQESTRESDMATYKAIAKKYQETNHGGSHAQLN